MLREKHSCPTKASKKIYKKSLRKTVTSFFFFIFIFIFFVTYDEEGNEENEDEYEEETENEEEEEEDDDSSETLDDFPSCSRTMEKSSLAKLAYQHLDEASKLMKISPLFLSMVTRVIIFLLLLFIFSFFFFIFIFIFFVTLHY